MPWDWGGAEACRNSPADGFARLRNDRTDRIEDYDRVVETEGSRGGNSLICG